MDENQDLAQQPVVGPPAIIQLVIKLRTSDGAVNVQGPVADKILCYGILELARDAIKEYKVPTIQTAPADLLASLKNNGHK